MFNIYGNGILGRVDVSWNYVRVPDDCGGETVITTRTDSKSYYIKDHLGSIRQTIKETGTFSSARDYYPYGETLRAYVAGSANDKYQFTGKERDKETNFDYFGARYYACPVKGGDSEFARWNSVDPMSSKYPGWSSYNYCLNNPMLFFDPHGDTVVNIYEPGTDEYEYVEFTLSILKESKDGLRLYNKLNGAKEIFKIAIRDLSKVSGGAAYGTFSSWNDGKWFSPKLTGGTIALDPWGIKNTKENGLLLRLFLAMNLHMPLWLLTIILNIVTIGMTQMLIPMI